MPKRKDLRWIQDLAQIMGGICLSTEYKNVETKYRWRCQEGHEWEATAHHVKDKHWCPSCSGRNNRGIPWLEKLALDRGGRCLSVAYEYSDTLYHWRCGSGHEWDMKANNVQQGQWCPYCAGVSPHDLQWLSDLAATRGGVCLSESYVNTKTKYKWRCGKGHEWEAKANDVQQGQWCPHCVYRISRGERILGEFVKTIYPDTVNTIRGVLRDKRYELDIYIPSLRAAIEYDGGYWHTKGDCVKRDLKKNEMCREAKVRLLRVDDSRYRSDPNSVNREVLEWLRGGGDG